MQQPYSNLTTGFWGNMPGNGETDSPWVVLAPMADVTDRVFRRLFAKYGKPEVTWTEFVSADGLFLRPIEEGVSDKPKDEFEEICLQHGAGTDHPLLHDLRYVKSERPIVAQFFSRDPQRMKRAAQLAVALGYDGIDINMGCPAQVICKQGAGCAMIKDPQTAQKVIYAAQEGVDGKIPVTVKTRLGFNSIEIEQWVPHILKTNPAVLTMHMRTRKDMSKVDARWEHMQRIIEIRNELNPNVKIIGNGDVVSREHANQLAAQTGCDGIMVGRGIFGNPWFFNKDIQKSDLDIKTILTVMLEHTKLFVELLGGVKNFALMKKHYKAYVTGFDGAKELRVKLIEAKTYNEIQKRVEEFLEEELVVDISDL